MGAQEASLVADQLAESKIPLIVNPINNIPNSFDELASNINLSSRLEDEGILLMFNASRDHNYHLIRQGAGIAVANGMSYGGAIKALSSNVATAFNIQDRGTIKQGKVADLIVFDKDKIIKTLPLFSSEKVSKVNFFQSLATSLNYLIWGDV